MGRRTLPLAKLAEHDWVEADRVQLKAGSSAELASIPAFTTSTIYLVTGLLLPIWKRIPQKSTRVYRLQTDAGERIIGRKVPLSWVTAMSAERPALAAEDAFAALLRDGDPTRTAPPPREQRFEPSPFHIAQPKSCYLIKASRDSDALNRNSAYADTPN